MKTSIYIICNKCHKAMEVIDSKINYINIDNSGKMTIRYYCRDCRHIIDMVEKRQ